MKRTYCERRSDAPVVQNHAAFIWSKVDTFVLDFRNDGDEIQRAFGPYYGRTVAPPSDPNLPWDTRHQLDAFDVLRPDEIETAVAVLVTLTDPKGHGGCYALLDPAVDRFRDLEEADQATFNDALDRFVRTYGFLAQIVSFGETKRERDYLYCRALASLLRDASTIERLDLSSEVELTRLRTEPPSPAAWPSPPTPVERAVTASEVGPTLECPGTPLAEGRARYGVAVPDVRATQGNESLPEASHHPGLRRIQCLRGVAALTWRQETTCMEPGRSRGSPTRQPIEQVPVQRHGDV